MSPALTAVKRSSQSSVFPAVALFVIMSVVTAVVNPRFLSPVGLSNFFGAYLPLTIAAIAIAVVMIGGGIDLSIGATMSLTNVVFITAVEAGRPALVATALALVCAVAVGGVNGVLVAWGRIPPLLATLGTMFVVSGACLVVMPVPSGSAPSNLVVQYAAGIAYVPVPVVLLLAALVGWKVLSRTKFSLRLYGTGSNSRAAFGTGLPVTRITAASYVLCSAVAGGAAMALTANVATGGPAIATSFTLNAIAAAVIGGVSLLGGSGSPVGAAFGALFLGLVSGLVFALGVSSFYVSVVSGAVVLGGILFTSLVRRRREVLTLEHVTVAPGDRLPQEAAR